MEHLSRKRSVNLGASLVLYTESGAFQPLYHPRTHSISHFLGLYFELIHYQRVKLHNADSAALSTAQPTEIAKVEQSHVCIATGIRVFDQALTVLQHCFQQYIVALLRLPKEIRSQIYGYVLGGRTIHIRATATTVGHAFEVRVCKSSENPDVNQFTCKLLPRDAPIVDRHAECRESLDLAFLHTSRQVYSEVRWMPFTSNRFAVGCDHISDIHDPGAFSDLLQSERHNSGPSYMDCGTLLSSFLKNRLMPSQIRAIAHLITEEASYSHSPVIKWYSSVQGLNHLKSFDVRINALLDEKNDLQLLSQTFTRDLKRRSLLRRQEHCRSIRVSLKLHNTRNVAISATALSSTQSKMQLWASTSAT